MDLVDLVVGKPSLLCQAVVVLLEPVMHQPLLLQGHTDTVGQGWLHTVNELSGHGLLFRLDHGARGVAGVVVAACTGADPRAGV